MKHLAKERTKTITMKILQIGNTIKSLNVSVQANNVRQSRFQKVLKTKRTAILSEIQMNCKLRPLHVQHRLNFE